MSPLFDRYTDRAKRVLALATDEARRLDHSYIGTEHILLGIVREGEGKAAATLAEMGVDLTTVRDAVKYIIGRGKGGQVSEMRLTPRAKQVIEFATEEARRLGHEDIDAEHFLLGLVREGEGIAAGILESLGVNLTELGAAVEAASGPEVRAGQEDTTGRAEQDAGTEIRLTPGARKAISLAAEEARRLGHEQIGTGHLLLGLAREGEGFAAGILRSLGVTLERLRRQVRQAVSQGDTS